MTLPPWLAVSPQDYLSAAQSGLQSGLAAAHLWQQANEFNTRLSEAAKENQIDRQAKSETEERAFLVQQQRNLMEAEYKHQLISQRQQQTQQAAEIAKEKAQEGIAHWQQMQKVAELRARAGKVLGPGAAMVDDTGKVLYERPFKPGGALTQSDKAQELKIKAQIKEWDKKISAEKDEDKKDTLQKQQDALYDQLGRLGQPMNDTGAVQPSFQNQPEPTVMAGPDWMPQTGLIATTPPVDAQDEEPERVKTASGYSFRELP